MSVEADIHAALMARAETLTGYTMIWPQKGGDHPAGEHVRVSHLPNDNDPLSLSGQTYVRQGFLVLTLVTDLGLYEATTKRKAGEIAAHFPRGLRLTRGSVTVTISGHSVRAGRAEEGRWETPIFISYRCAA